MIHATAGELDPRLNLANCQMPLTATLPPAAHVTARVTVGVGCGQPRWTLYVPVTVETELPVLVLREARRAAAKSPWPTSKPACCGFPDSPTHI